MQTSFFISSRFSEKAKEDKTMKFLHCADIHLDSPFSLALPADAGKRRTELRSVFSSAVLYAKTEGCKLFLIAGDLFDDDFVTKDTMEMLVHEFSAFPSCQFVISPGNHDPFCERSPYKLTEWPENVHIFESPEMGYFDIPESDVRVWGYAFTSDTLTSPPLAGFHIPTERSIFSLPMPTSAHRFHPMHRFPKKSLKRAVLPMPRSVTFIKQAEFSTPEKRRMLIRAVSRGAASTKPATKAHLSVSLQKKRLNCAPSASASAAMRSAQRKLRERPPLPALQTNW